MHLSPPTLIVFRFRQFGCRRTPTIGRRRKRWCGGNTSLTLRPRQRAVVAGGGGGGSVSVGVDVVAFVLERVPSVGRAKPRT